VTSRRVLWRLSWGGRADGEKDPSTRTVTFGPPNGGRGGNRSVIKNSLMEEAKRGGTNKKVRKNGKGEESGRKKGKTRRMPREEGR